MNATPQHPLPSPMLASLDVEVALLPGENGFYAEVHGGALDGEQFAGHGDPAEFQRRICVMCRMKTWPRFRARWQRRG